MSLKKLPNSDIGTKPPQAKFETFGVEMVEKKVKQNGKTGRVYLPLEWEGKHIKIIRID